MDTLEKKCLISVAELKACYQHKHVRVVEALRGDFSIFTQRHLPDAIPFDIDDIADPAAPLPHCLPNEEFFVEKIEPLGLHQTDCIVIYDKEMMAVAARVWWTLRVFGYQNVVVLNGGFDAWEEAGGKVTSELSSKKEHSSCMPEFHEELVKNYTQIKDNLIEKEYLLVDTRPSVCFQQDHIPGSINLPWEAFIENGTILEKDSLKKIFEEKNIDWQKPLAVSCNSGVTACVAALVLAILGRWDIPVYDGSFQEWSYVR